MIDLITVFLQVINTALFISLIYLGIVAFKALKKYLSKRNNN